eukprot:INCI3715.1.p1 GENE.INCI3715.1~~INCI3715.1.p1  ORF type:complete len:534 (+),score=76.64 INCI3715.1:142-1743(+)
MPTTLLSVAWTCFVVVVIPSAIVLLTRAKRRPAKMSSAGANKPSLNSQGAVKAARPSAPEADTADTLIAQAKGGTSTRPNHQPEASIQSPNNYSVMTYNILAPDYANPAWFPGTNRGQLKWGHRRPKIMEKIATCNPDLLCLQEVQVGQCRHSFQEFLSKQGYHFAYSMKCNEQADPVYDSATLGVLACWKRNKFRQIGKPRTIALAQYVSGLFGGDSYFSSGNWQVGVVTLLEPLPHCGSSKRSPYILLISVHMMAPRGDHDYRRKYEQLVQTYALLRAILDLKLEMEGDPTKPFTSNPADAPDSGFSRLGVAPPFCGLHQNNDSDEKINNETASTDAPIVDDTENSNPQTTPDAPDAPSDTAVEGVSIVLCGDFNAPPTSASYHLLRFGLQDAQREVNILQKMFLDSLRFEGEKRMVMGKLSLQSLRAPGQLPSFASAFECVHGVEPKHTNFTANFRDCIDYVFVEHPRDGNMLFDGGLDPIDAEIRPHFELEQLFRGTPQRSLPSDKFPSDHLPVVVTLQAVDGPVTPTD